jgi:hypothetical protein
MTKAAASIYRNGSIEMAKIIEMKNGENNV